MKKISVFIALFFLMTSFSILFAQPDDRALQLWNSFQAKNGNNWRITWENKLGIPENICLGKTKPYSGDSLEIAKSFLKENNDLFKMKKDLSDLILVDSKKYLNLTHITFKQVYENIEVENSYFLVHILPSGEVMMANGKYFSDIKISTKPSISLEEAMKVAATEIKGNIIPGSKFENKLVIFPDENYIYHLAWNFMVPTENPHARWIYYVDANDGKILNKYNGICSYSGKLNDENIKEANYPINKSKAKGRFNKLTMVPDWPGIGFYPINPNVSQYTEEQVPVYTSSLSLNWDGVIVHNLRYGDADRSLNNWTFIYDISDNHFDDANVYALLMRDNGYRQGSGLPLWGGPIYVHNPQYGSFFDYYGPPQAIYYGDVDKYGNLCEHSLARDAGIVFHEYTHASIQTYVNHYISQNDESHGISEGLADYFPCIFLNRSIIGDYFGQPRDAENPTVDCWCTFSLNQNRNLPTNPPSEYTIHDIGNLFCHILWTLRTIVSSQTVLQATYSFTPGGTIQNFRDVLIGVDGGAHTSEIQSVFNQHINPALFSINHKDNQLLKTINSNNPTDFSLIQNYPNPFNPETNIKYSITTSSIVSIKIFNVLGKEIETILNSVREPGEYSIKWAPKNLPSGIYYYKIQAGTYSNIKKMLYVR